MVGIPIRHRINLGMWVILSILMLPGVQIVLAGKPSCPPFPTVIIALAEQIPFSITSWIRTPKRNKLVGGVPDSKHLRGLAVDLVLDDWNDALKLLALIDPSCIQVGMETGYIHLEQYGP